ncbi:YjcQ family protein [Peptostreptococcus sp. D1]|uniref:YjcQ family protein n=1 Tax=Peptostreptococcus sp. D1 TaxID=72304 RepID=UPI0008EBC0FC|nr:YjcQ family protein [Peptostreptococcus sp. D1]SFE47362.1 YjcQ protein [Peptostreptococcus sp. D1]
MDNLKIVYKILVGIEASMDSSIFDGTFLEALKISEERRNKILQSMIDDGLIDGFARINYHGGYGFKAIEPRLTIKGMEFLQENSTMQKIKNGLKDVKDITPFI